MELYLLVCADDAPKYRHARDALIAGVIAATASAPLCGIDVCANGNERLLTADGLSLSKPRASAINGAPGDICLRIHRRGSASSASRSIGVHERKHENSWDSAYARAAESLMLRVLLSTETRAP